MANDSLLIFTGKSVPPKSSVDEALQNAITAAAQALQGNFEWTLRKIEGSYGGFVFLTVNAEIEANSSSHPSGPSADPNRRERVHEVTKVETSWVDRTRVRIECVGRVSSSGWTNAQLVAHTYVQPPPDGIWGFDLVATPPAGVGLPSLEDVRVEYEWTVPYGSTPAPRGVRISAASNTLEKLFT